MSNYELAFARNLGFISQAEQDKLSETSVAIAGAGGDGGELAVLLARMGFGEIRLADPDPFEIENINRQAVCTTRTVGMNKAVAVAEYLHEINPDISTPVYTDGVTRDNVGKFVEGADLVIDETEFTEVKTRAFRSILSSTLVIISLTREIKPSCNRFFIVLIV